MARTRPGGYGSTQKRPTALLVGVAVLAIAILAAVVFTMTRDNDGTDETTTTEPTTNGADAGTPGIDSMLIAWPKTEEGAMNAVGHWAPMWFTLNEDQSAVVTRTVALPDSEVALMSQWPEAMRSHLTDHDAQDLIAVPLAVTGSIDGDDATVQMLIEFTIPGYTTNPGSGTTPAWTRFAGVHEWRLTWQDGRWWVKDLLATDAPAQTDPAAVPFDADLVLDLGDWRAVRSGYAGLPILPLEDGQEVHFFEAQPVSSPGEGEGN